MDVRWSDQYPKAPSLPHLPLERIKPGGPTLIVVTTTRLLGVQTHFLGQRTLPCISHDCPGCERSLPCRWEGYLAGITKQPRRHIIVALTPAAAVGIADTAPDPMNLRGLLVTFDRCGKRNNSKLKATAERIELSQLTLPNEPDLKAHLLHIWGLDQSQLGQDAPSYADHIRKHFSDQGATPDASTDP